MLLVAVQVMITCSAKWVMTALMAVSAAITSLVVLAIIFICSIMVLDWISYRPPWGGLQATPWCLVPELLSTKLACSSAIKATCRARVRSAIDKWWSVLVATMHSLSKGANGTAILAWVLYGTLSLPMALS